MRLQTTKAKIALTNSKRVMYRVSKAREWLGKPPAAMYNGRKKAKLVISRGRNWRRRNVVSKSKIYDQVQRTDIATKFDKLKHMRVTNEQQIRDHFKRQIRLRRNWINHVRVFCNWVNCKTPTVYVKQHSLTIWVGGDYSCDVMFEFFN